MTGSLLLALHSSSQSLGVATLDRRDPLASERSAVFPVGHSLTNVLFDCVQELLPASRWSEICRLAVAIGPGSFTGIRLTVTMARTLAQQLDCPLDGISSFALMVPRLSEALSEEQRRQPFWLVRYLPRRGALGGHYRLAESTKEVIELKPPHLLDIVEQTAPLVLKATDDVARDTLTLLSLCATAANKHSAGPWHRVLPLYGTSPART